MDAKKITKGAILLALYGILLLIFLYVPFIGTVFLFVLPLPFIYYAAKYNWKNGLLFFLAANILTAILSVLALPVTFLSGLIGITYGWGIHQKKDRFIIFSTGTLSLLFGTVVVYLAAALIMDMNIVGELIGMAEETFRQSLSMVEKMGEDITPFIELFEQYSKKLAVLFPSILILSTTFTAIIIQLFCFPILRRIGIFIPKGKPFREITMPKSLIWYF